MRKYILFSVFFLCVGLTNAQIRLIGYGVKAGVNVSNIRSNLIAFKDILQSSMVTISKPPVMGLNAGSFVQFSLNSRLELQPQVLYSQTGYNISIANPAGSDLDFNYRFSYLNVPLLLKYHVKDFSVSIGPQLGFMLNASRKINEGTKILEASIKKNMRSTDFSGIIGLDYTLPKQGILFSANFQLGLTDIASTKNDPAAFTTLDPKVDSYIFDPVKLNAFSFTVGYTFKPKIQKKKSVHKTTKK